MITNNYALVPNLPKPVSSHVLIYIVKQIVEIVSKLESGEEDT